MRNTSVRAITLSVPFSVGVSLVLLGIGSALAATGSWFGMLALGAALFAGIAWTGVAIRARQQRR